MIPHKTARGAAALERLKVFEGVPPPYDKVKRVVVPQALRVLRLKPGRKYCTVGRLSHEVGWKYQDVVARLVLIARCWSSRKRELTIVIDLRRGERLRVQHTTHARRPPEDNYLMPKRARKLTTRPRSSWLNMVTRQIFPSELILVWMGFGNLFTCFFVAFFAIKQSNHRSMLCSTLDLSFAVAGKMCSRPGYFYEMDMHGWGGFAIIEKRALMKLAPMMCISFRFACRP